MKKMFDSLKKMPPEYRVLLGMAGLATPFGILYFLQKHVFRKADPLVLVLGLAILVGVLLLIGWLVSRLFGRAASKRKQQMERKLADDAAAANVSMDLAEAIKHNNEQFFGAVGKLRKRGISVYDLPWYIVIGDSGCGKTKLINEGGLTLGEGRPEGHQLGTLNYNWWFSEDAIFIDMAGRLCNPQVDADRQEWEAFLDTIAAGRKGYPINGAILCISAEHLLQDPAARHENDADIMLERLRDLQNKLGVTFATYVVITKCDKILGFMPFFHRAKSDITIKHQIFGWSRPGAFNDPFDPEQFAGSFDALCDRLYDLRLRRLYDDPADDRTDDTELGLAYSYPEEFRQLRDPLGTYVQTLFPRLKTTRVAKNLIFRGVYFTSATQKGDLILQRLIKSAGDERVAEQFKPLDSLYPSPRPHFVKDLLFRKVFPEHGIVFRNEKDVVRNRRLARLLTFTTAIVSVLLLGAFGFGAYQFGGLIKDPSVRALAAVETTASDGASTSRTSVAVEAGVADVKPIPAETLAFAGQLGADSQRLRLSPWPRVLSLAAAADKPADDLLQIQRWLFESQVLPKVLAAAERALCDTSIVADRDVSRGTHPEGHQARLGDYLAALEAYLAWYGCAAEPTWPAALTADRFAALCGIIPPDAALFRELDRARRLRQEYDGAYSPSKADAKFLVDQFAMCFELAAGPNPASVFAARHDLANQTIQAAIHELYERGVIEVTLNSASPDPIIRAWCDVQKRCAEWQQAYSAILSVQDTDLDSWERLQQFRLAFDGHYAQVAENQEVLPNELPWPHEQVGSRQIPPLRDALVTWRNRWLQHQENLRAAYADSRKLSASAPAGDQDDPVLRAIEALTIGDSHWNGVPGLDCALFNSAADCHLLQPGTPLGADLFESGALEFINEVTDTAAWGYLIQVRRGTSTYIPDTLICTPALQQQVRPVLADIHAALRDMESEAEAVDCGAGETAAAWIEQLAELQQAADASHPPRDDTTVAADLKHDARWHADELARLKARLRGEIVPKWNRGTLLRRIRACLSVADRAWGFGELAPHWYESKSGTAYAIEIPSPPTSEGPTAAQEAYPQLVKPGRPTPLVGPGTDAASPASNYGSIPYCADPDEFTKNARLCIELLVRLSAWEGGDLVLSRPGERLLEDCRQAVIAAWGTYCRKYIRCWQQAYAAKRFAGRSDLLVSDDSWQAFANRVGARPRMARAEIGPALHAALSEILHVRHWPLYEPDGTSLWHLQSANAVTAAMAREVRDEYTAAVDDLWPDEILRDRGRPRHDWNSGVPEWEGIARKYAEAWDEWCEKVGRNADLPALLDRSYRAARGPVEIPWTLLDKLRDEYGMDAEHLTGDLADLQLQATDLLSNALTDVFCDIQDELSTEAPDAGWPYLSAAAAPTSDPLRTVQWAYFTTFLMNVQAAGDILQGLDRELPETASGRTPRRKFLDACRIWYDFLGLDSRGAAAPLTVEVWTEDPLRTPVGRITPEDSGQLFYDKVCLKLGLRRENAPDESIGEGLVFGTGAENRHKRVMVVWNWRPVQSIQNSTFALLEGLPVEGCPDPYPPLAPQILGGCSPLSFCAYLYRYGEPAEGDWYVTHAIDRCTAAEDLRRTNIVQGLTAEAQEPQAGQCLIGEKFVFRLPSGRALPVPIPKLERPDDGLRPAR